MMTAFGPPAGFGLGMMNIPAAAPVAAPTLPTEIVSEEIIFVDLRVRVGESLVPAEGKERTYSSVSVQARRMEDGQTECLYGVIKKQGVKLSKKFRTGEDMLGALDKIARRYNLAARNGLNNCGPSLPGLSNGKILFKYASDEKISLYDSAGLPCPLETLDEIAAMVEEYGERAGATDYNEAADAAHPWICPKCNALMSTSLVFCTKCGEIKPENPKTL